MVNGIVKVTIFRIFLVALLFAATTNNPSYSQVGDSIRIELGEFEKAVRYNRPLSYVIFSQGFGNLEPILIEARLAPNFFFTNRKKSFAVQFTPNILLRIKDKKSFPVENPSYFTPLYYHQKLPFWKNTFLAELIQPNAYLSLGLHHHSKGQDGEFYVNDTLINIDNGSFSTNYYSVALSTYNFFESLEMPAFRSIRICFEHHIPWPKNYDQENLISLYGMYRLFINYQVLNLGRKDAAKASWFSATQISRPG